MRVLLSNDDGIDSAGLAALHAELSKVGEVFVVAPDREQSAASHAITLSRPLRIRERRPRWFEVDGTPTDCVYVGVNHLLKSTPPDVVCAGINHGPNLGNDVIYSGTVAAAMEGALLGISSIAFSYCGSDDAFQGPAQFAARLASQVAARALPHKTLLNVNFPESPSDLFEVTCLGKRTYGQAVVEKIDPRGRRYYWIGGDEPRHEDIPGSDCNAVFDRGAVSVTPLHLDLTDHRLLDALSTWEVPGYVRRR